MLICAFILMLFIAAVSDFLILKVSNQIILILFILALMIVKFEQNCFFYMDDSETIFSSAFLLLILLPGFIYHVFGAADVKILLIISLISPFSLMLDILLYTFIAFMLYWLIAVRDTKVHAPFIPSLLVGMGIAVWLA